MSLSIYERLKRLLIDWGIAEEDISPEASFMDDLNLDPIDLGDLFLTVEEEFDVEIPDKEARRLLTVHALVEYIEDQL